MTVRIKNLTSSLIRIDDLRPFDEIPGNGFIEPPVETAKRAIGYIVEAVNKTLVEFDAALLEEWEKVELGLTAPGGATAGAEEDSTIVLIQPPAVQAGQVDYELWYALGAGPGDPATKITYSYADPLFPTTVTGIKIEHTTLP